MPTAEVKTELRRREALAHPDGAYDGECIPAERAPGHSAHIADSAPLPVVEWAAVTKRRSASSGLLPRDQVRAWVSAAKAVGCVPVGVLGWTG